MTENFVIWLFQLAANISRMQIINYTAIYVHVPMYNCHI